MKKLVYFSFILLFISCNKDILKKNNNDQSHLSQRRTVSLPSVAKIFSSLDIGPEQMQEVHNAVKSSSDNGYDEEYPMIHLFEKIGQGVGSAETRANRQYNKPLHIMIEEYLKDESKTRSGSDSAFDVDLFLKLLKTSDIQIYWPYHENWDGHSLPIITFDPGKNVASNKGYLLAENQDGSKYIKQIIVTEEIAKRRPVWVINKNTDMNYTSVELLRRKSPNWGSNSGGTLVYNYYDEEQYQRSRSNYEQDLSEKAKSLIIKDIEVKRNYDSWFAGASEFFFRCGSIENFTASTPAELKLYYPTITDFMLVIRRSQVNKKIPFNALLVSEWTQDLKSVAFMVIEDDGGPRTEWNCSALVKYNSRGYGFDISLPLNSYDDIVWRGNLTQRYINTNNNITGVFGDMMITFEVK